MKRKVLVLTLTLLVSLSLNVLAEWGEFKPFIHNDSGTQRMPWYDNATRILYYVDDYDLFKTQWTGDNWTEPQPLAGPINTPENEISPLVRNNHLYFGRYDSSTNYDFYMATWNEDKKQWDNVQKLTELSSPEQEWKLWISEDEKTAYFTSNGSFGGQKVSGGRGVFRSIKVDGKWQTPVPLTGEINSDGNEWSIFVDETNNKFYVDSDRSGSEGGYDVWVLDGEDGKAVNPGWPINTSNHERSLWTNGEVIFLTVSGRPGGAGGYDIWIAKSSNSTSDIDLEKSAKQEASFSVTYGGEVGFKVLATPENLVESYTNLDLNTEILASNVLKAYFDIEVLQVSDSNWINIREISEAEKFELDEFYIEAQGPFYSGGKPVNLRFGNKISIDYHDYIINDGSRPGAHLSNLNIGGVDLDAAYMYRSTGGDVDDQFGLLYAARANTRVEDVELTGYYLGRINHEVIENGDGEKSYVFPSRYAQHTCGLEGKYSMEKGNINGLFIYQNTANRDETGELETEEKFEHVAKIDFFYPLLDNLNLEVGLREFTKDYEYPYVDEDESDIEDYIGQTGGHIKLATVFKELIQGSDLNFDTNLDYYTLDEKGTATLTLNGQTSISDVDLSGKVEVQKPEDADENYIYGFNLIHNFELFPNQYASLDFDVEQDTDKDELTSTVKLDTKLNRGLFRGAELWAEVKATKTEDWENVYTVGAKYEMPNGLTYIMQYRTPNDPIDDYDDEEEYDYDNFFELSAIYEF